MSNLLSSSDKGEMKISKELNTKIDNAICASYTYQSIVPQVSGDVVCTATQEKSIAFTLPDAVAINLAKSYLSWTETYSANASLSIFSTEDTWGPIHSMNLKAGTSKYIAEAINIPEYLKVIYPRETKKAEYEERDEYQKFHPSHQARGYPFASIGSGGTDAAKASAVYVSSQSNQPLDPASGIPTALADRVSPWLGNSLSTGFLSPLDFKDNTHWSYALATAPITRTNQRYYFSDLKNTVFAYGKDIALPSQGILTVSIGKPVDYCWEQKTDLLSPTYTLDNRTAYRGTATFSNIQFHLALENDQKLATSIVGKMKAGMQVMLANSYQPVITAISTASTHQNQDVQIQNPGGEAYLRKIYHTAFNYEESLGYKYDNTNSQKCDLAYNDASASAITTGTSPSVRIAKYNTLLDQTPLQPIGGMIDCDNDEDYQLQLELLKGTAVYNSKHFKSNWSHCDDWTNGNTDEDVMAGLKMDKYYYTYHFRGLANTNVKAQHYTFYIIQQKMLVSPSGIMYL